MATVNKKSETGRILTHEGAIAKRITPLQELERSIMACLLWENTFYESGEDIAQRIADLVAQVPALEVDKLARRARDEMYLRHAPLWLARNLARQGYTGLASLLEHIIQRPDELTEFLAIYWKDGREKLSAQVKKGLARAFVKFNEYQLAKYNRDGAVKLRDVLFLCHAKPKNEEQAELWKRLVDKTLTAPDTWEVSLSAGKDKKETFTRLLSEKKLGGLALLRNLRNMQESGVDSALIRSSLETVRTEKILPFRFIAAAKYAPQYEDTLEQAMMRNLSEMPKLSGKTALVIDNSGSMHGAPVSAKSDMDRADAACALAILLREICEDVTVIGFGTTAKVIAPRHGFALAEAIQAGPGGGTNTDTALGLAFSQNPDRIIVVTDEQSHQTIAGPGNTRGYFINVATDRNGIGYGQWIHVDGWSEAIVRYIQAIEGARSSEV